MDGLISFISSFGDPEFVCFLLLLFGFIVGFSFFFILYSLDCIISFIRSFIKKSSK